jgi:type II secretory pathway pseudopilin PulG
MYNSKKPTAPPIRTRGITLVEILIVISLLVIVLSFAIPSVGNATARAELSAARENVHYSIDAARDAARRAEKSVRLTIESPGTDAPQTITFQFEGDTAKRYGPGLQEYRLPESIRLVADQDRFVFDRRGLVENPGRILLVARTDDSLTSALDVE